MDKMVEIQNVTKRFADAVAVDDVSLDIRGGEFITLLGPSGCGKTTLLRMISGFETPTKGTVRLDGQDVTGLPPFKRGVNQVFQSYALFPHLNVFKNVAFGLQMRRLGRAEIATRVEKAIDLVALRGLEQRKPSQLSGGQRQRVALARALVCEPKVLLLDEPLAALDAKLRHSMQVELKYLQSRLGITFLFVTHDQEEALVMSDRIAVFNRGKVEQIGPADDIYHRPATPFVADFIGQANIVTTTARPRGDGAATLTSGDLILVIQSATPLEAEQKVVVSIRPEKIRLSRTPLVGSAIFTANVIDEIFRGVTTQFVIETAGGVRLTAVVANQGAAVDAVHRGDAVHGAIHADDVVLLRSDA